MLTKQAAHRKDTRSAPATFTHQHFRKVAEIIRQIPEAYRVECAARFGEALAATNPKFDRHRFLMACQPQKDA